jgi:hypothetical protein
MDEADLTAQIALLEAQIEDLAERLERCRKLKLASKLAIAAGLAVIGVMLLGVIGSSPTATVAGLAAVIGGIVVYGSNNSTATQTVAALRAAEAQRARLIGMINLRLVGETLH